MVTVSHGAVADVHLQRAIELVAHYTGWRMNASYLTGPSNARARQAIYSALMGRLMDEKPVPKSQCGINKVLRELYSRAGIDADTIRGREIAFAELCQQVAGPKPVC